MDAEDGCMKSPVSRLAVMMALAYGVQGAWWPLLAVHLQDLGVSGRGQGWIFATMALASLTTPLGVGHLADRRWSIEWLLAGIYGLGTVFLISLALGPTRRADLLFALFLGYWLLSAPAYGLAASLALRNLARPHVQYGSVRLWGTVGWMVMGWLVSLVMATVGMLGSGAAPAFWVAAGLSAITAIYCLTLPHTPPLALESRPGTNLVEGLELLKCPSVAVYLLSAFAVCLTTPYMYQILPPFLRDRGLPVSWIPVMMTLGQFPEIIALAVLPRIVGRIGYRGTLALGIGAWVVRFATLAIDPPLWVALAGIPLHGLAIASFHIGGQLFLDAQALPHRRASAQGLYVLTTNGIGSLLGNLMAGELLGMFNGRYGLMFLVPAFINLGAFILFVSRFRPAIELRTDSLPRGLGLPSGTTAAAAGRLGPDNPRDLG
jgi:MFS family permease